MKDPLVYSFNDTQQMMKKAKQEGFDAGAHQAMQETRLEIALNLIKQVAVEESKAGHDVSYGLTSVATDLLKELIKFRYQSGRI